MVETKKVKTTKQETTQAFVSKQFKSGTAEGPLKSEDELIAVHQFVTEPARVSVELGLTLNLGNFESARVSAVLSVPCYKEEADAAFEYAKVWVADRIAKEVEDIRNNAKGNVL